MNEDLLRQVIEESDPDNKIPPETVEELVAALSGSNKKLIDVPDISVESIVDTLKASLTTESDWRKRASIAAKIISLGLE